jgi:hypothetical protein
MVMGTVSSRSCRGTPGRGCWAEALWAGRLIMPGFTCSVASLGLPCGWARPVPRLAPWAKFFRRSAARPTRRMPGTHPGKPIPDQFPRTGPKTRTDEGIRVQVSPQKLLSTQKEEKKLNLLLPFLTVYTRNRLRVPERIGVAPPGCQSRAGAGSATPSVRPSGNLAAHSIGILLSMWPCRATSFFDGGTVPRACAPGLDSRGPPA